jgi:hypothetical protein
VTGMSYGEPRVAEPRHRAVREGPRVGSGEKQSPPAARYYGEDRSRGAKRSGGFRGVVPPDQHSTAKP